MKKYILHLEFLDKLQDKLRTEMEARRKLEEQYDKIKGKNSISSFQQFSSNLDFNSALDLMSNQLMIYKVLYILMILKGSI